jgi:hypothetical protein
MTFPGQRIPDANLEYVSIVIVKVHPLSPPSQLFLRWLFLAKYARFVGKTSEHLHYHPHHFWGDLLCALVTT